MQRTSLPALSLTLIAVALTLVAGAAQAEDARNAQILGNLKLAYPQLAELDVTLGEITPSEIEGLDQGSFIVPSKQGPRAQTFLVTSDNTRLFIIAGVVDVSKSPEEIAVEVARLEAENAEKAAKAKQEMDAAIADRPMRGKADAPVTIVEFSDFQCPYCSRGATTMEQVLEKYPEDVRFVYMNFPLGFHPWAKPAATASYCAGLQSHEAFWTLHDGYFEQQKALTPENVIDRSKGMLADAGIDLDQWSTCAEDQASEEHKAAVAQVEADIALGQKLGVSGTPGFFVNGQFLNGAQPLSAFEPLIEQVRQGS